MSESGSKAKSATARGAAHRGLALAGLLATLSTFLSPSAVSVPNGAGTSAGESAAAGEDAAVRPLYLDKSGVVRWRDSNEEASLYGANYCVMSGSDYRMAGLVADDRKAMIDEDLAHFARLGWTALRLCTWGDWENSDAAGHLVQNEHVDLLDYVVAKARERGLYLLLTPIHTYDPAFADQLDRPSANQGFSRYFARPEMGTNPRSIAAQAQYISELLQHVNPYTGVALKDEPALAFIELINEPVHHPEDTAGSINYINTLVAAVRATGCTKITFFNVSQDFAIAPAIQQSRVDGVSFGWYPTSLSAGHTLQGNFLQAVDAYPDMLRPELRGRPRIVYEFDQADLLSGYLYPAMARTFRSVGAQFATMFAYDMLRTAPYNLGWQTHYLNLVHTPKKAVSAAIAAEVMRRLPRMQDYGRYPDNLRFGDFRVSYAEDLSELNTPEVFMNAGTTHTAPRDPRALREIVGFGSSPLVDYEGTGAYFLDKVRDGIWRLEVYPDEVLVRDPFEQPQPGKVVSRLLYRSWPLALQLPDLGRDYFVTPIHHGVESPIHAGAESPLRASNATFRVTPGVWLLTRSNHVARDKLPEHIARVGLAEYHVNERVTYPDFVQTLAAQEYLAGQPVEIRARVANDTLPDNVELWIRAVGTRHFGKPIPMTRLRGNDYAATLSANAWPAGLYEYAVSTTTGARVTTFPGGQARRPNDWPFLSEALWTFRVTPRGTPLRLLDPGVDADRLSFVRPAESYRDPFLQITPGESADEAALVLGMPKLGNDTPERYAAALYIGGLIAPRKSEAALADTLAIKARSVGGPSRSLQVTLVEQDGTAWATSVVANSAWSTISVPLAALRISRSIHIPSPYPGLWNYWKDSPARRGGTGDRVRIENVERLQLTVTPDSSELARDAAPGVVAPGVAIESIRLTFAGRN